MAENSKNQVPKVGGPPAHLLKTAEPVRAFDDYYYVGNYMVGIHILKTSEGLVLFDSADQTDADEKYLIPGLKKLGLENEKILIIFLTHGHFDHYVGAEHIRLRTGCDVAISRTDAAYMVSSVENRGPDKPQVFPRITRLVEDGEEYTFGEHTISVMSAPGHTPGCLNYSFEVHDGEEAHRILFFGGYGVFGPGSYPETDAPSYPYSTLHAVDQAFQFATSCVKSWEYCKETNCDVYINPHPQLCGFFEHAEKNKARKPGEPNAFVIGREGVRKWLEERFDVCIEFAQRFTDIQKEYRE